MATFTITEMNKPFHELFPHYVFVDIGGREERDQKSKSLKNPEVTTLSNRYRVRIFAYNSELCISTLSGSPISLRDLSLPH